MTIGWPQLTLLVLLAIEVGINIGKHGEPKPNPNHHAGIALLGAGIVITILWWGGFWDGCVG